MQYWRLLRGLASRVDDHPAVDRAAAKIDRARRGKALIQSEPVLLMDGAGREVKVFVDAVARHEDRIIIVGWSTSAAIAITLAQQGKVLDSKITRHARGDVCEALSLPSGEALGFCLLSEPATSAAAPELTITIPGAAAFRTGPLADTGALSTPHQARVPVILRERIAAIRRAAMGSADWWAALAALPVGEDPPPGLGGFIEGVLASPAGGGVVHGWALHPEDALVWLEDETQALYPLDSAFRRARKDISPDRHSGFIAYLPEVSRNPCISLRAVTDQGLFTVSHYAGAQILPSDPRGAAASLFGLETEAHDFERRARVIDWPILERLIAQKRKELVRLTPERRSFGTPPDAPEVSVIVPLYNRFDFMEHQVVEFLRDPFFRERAELIYVIDDPEISNAVLAEAHHLFQLHARPFHVVGGIQNRGYSGANNLGAQEARGRTLLFLNSDVIPLSPGWLQPMLATLEEDRIGAVGAQLLFADGGIQLLGMDFEYLHEYRIWSNQHPGAGMPACSPDMPAFEVPALTGACVMVPRTVFAEVGGWDTGYLIGDFEDSHLCFAIRNAGYRVKCQPAAMLTHLERQSFSALSDDAFRLRMTICNGLRHQTIWRDYLQPAMGRPDAPKKADAT